MHRQLFAAFGGGGPPQSTHGIGIFHILAGLMILRSVAPLLKLTGTVVGVLLLIDLTFFRSGMYYSWADPNSTAGSVERVLMTVADDLRPDRRNVLVLGNSRIGAAFSAPLADAASNRADLHFINASVAGTTPRVWHYLLCALDPNGDRFAAIALMVDYDVAEIHNDLTNYALDTAYLMPLLSVADIAEYPSSFSDEAQQESALRAILLPLQAMHNDVLDLLAHPFRRRHALRSSRRNAAYSEAHFRGSNETLPDLEFGADGMPIDWGDDAGRLRTLLLGYFRDLREPAPARAQAANAEYLRTWLGKIAQRYATHNVPVVVFVAPRGPWHGRLASPPTLGGPVEEVAMRWGMVPLPGDAFVSLEQPQFFFDAAHFNHYGRERFSPMLARELAARIR